MEINERKLGRPQIRSGRGTQANGRNFFERKDTAISLDEISAVMEMNDLSIYAAFGDKQQFISRRSRSSVMKIRDALQILRRDKQIAGVRYDYEKLVRSLTKVIVTSERWPMLRIPVSEFHFVHILRASHRLEAGLAKSNLAISSRSCV